MYEVNHLNNDFIRGNIELSLFKIGTDCELNTDALSSAKVKKKIIYFPVPTGQEWKKGIFLELLKARLRRATIENFNKDELTIMTSFAPSRPLIVEDVFLLCLQVVSLSHCNR